MEDRMMQLRPDLLGLISALSGYQRREERSSRATATERRRATPEELAQDGEVIASARLESGGRQAVYRWDNGEPKLRRSQILEILDRTAPERPPRRAAVLAFDPLQRRLELDVAAEGLPPLATLMPAPSHVADAVDEALQSFCRQPTAWPAALALLNRSEAPPDPGGPPPRLSEGDARCDSIVRRALALDGACLAVQGPPGTGKTHVGVRIALEAILGKRRVGLLAPSHKAIANFCAALARLAESRRVRNLSLVRSRDREGLDQISGVDMVDSLSRDFKRHHLLAGTIYQLCRLPPGALDLLIIDEAGQIPLAWAAAAGRLAKNIVILGDQRQLPQVSMAQHPGGGLSCLEHFAAGEAVIDPRRGEFLDLTWRMNPEITRFLSRSVYAGRLKSHPSTALHVLTQHEPRDPALGPEALVWLNLSHRGRSQSCPEEASEVERLCRLLLERGLAPEQMMIVVPFRAQEALLRARLPASLGNQIGTVDRFQGREADVVLFSMTCSDAESMPRDSEFLFSLERLNVALSRARCKAILLCGDKLLSSPARQLEQLRLMENFCRLKQCCLQVQV
ncbi:MAG: hypothetical protein RL095_1178 [Verrucomicrobiota bacterium]|jgi:uncharacterized protein